MIGGEICLLAEHLAMGAHFGAPSIVSYRNSSITRPGPLPAFRR